MAKSEERRLNGTLEGGTTLNFLRSILFSYYHKFREWVVCGVPTPSTQIRGNVRIGTKVSTVDG